MSRSADLTRKLAAALDERLVGGLADGKPDDRYDARELRRGIEVEYEHTNDPPTSKEIAKDHLEEIPDYYTRLDHMEATAERLKTALDKRAAIGLDRESYDTVEEITPHSPPVLGVSADIQAGGAPISAKPQIDGTKEIRPETQTPLLKSSSVNPTAVLYHLVSTSESRR